jgi:hypothetical protein
MTLDAHVTRRNLSIPKRRGGNFILFVSCAKIAIGGHAHRTIAPGFALSVRFAFRCVPEERSDKGSAFHPTSRPFH